ncbi:hypothetical protein [Aurantiacibacter sp. D1-12]|uniref:hypothetical protein n=1 Tax=Aurantiacibacter sp. D1-12 TaxID=2993658 RepID=UPI00237CDCDA|nr:hypothetical protein [Aurantiacibacter sp. D1-12]MDE1467721.1 hypothetical protein [Aurantiacibacter sp. D1-12]
MIRKIGLLIGVAACGALVTSCGGDDTPTPTPTDTSTATPTPTPSSGTIDFDLTAGFEANSNNANAIFAYFTPDGSTDQNFNGASRVNGSASVLLQFSPELARFAFPDLTNPVEFTDADLDSSTASTRTYARTGESLFLDRPFTHVLRVNYSRDDAFTRDTVDGTLNANRSTVFFNTVTTTDDLDTDLSYTGSVLVEGGTPGTTMRGDLSAADITFTVDADDADGDDAVSGTIEIIDSSSGSPVVVATLVMEKVTTTTNGTTTTRGVVNNEGFGGALTDTANSLEGTYAGALAGPDRDEVVILFSVASTETDNDTVYIGSFIGN